MSLSVLSAHIGYLYTEHDLLGRIGAAARAGFGAVEHPNPLSVDAGVMAAQLREHGLVFSQMGAASGDAARGEKGLAALAGRETDFRDAVLRSLDYAEAIGCPLVHPMAGVVIGGGAGEGAGTGAGAGAGGNDAVRQRAEETYLANLAFAVEQCRGRPVSILIEAISETAVPGYFLSRLDQAVVLADAVAPEQVSLLVDTFHAAANGTDLEAFVTAYADRIGHVHIADFPGRHEPGSGTLAFEPLLKQLTAQGYSGAIGFEYIPSARTDESLGWLPSFKTFLSA